MEQSIHRPSCQGAALDPRGAALDPLSAVAQPVRRPRLTSVTQLRASAQSAEWSGFAPSKPPRRIGIGYRIPMGEVVVPRPPRIEPQPSRARRLGQGKGRWSRASIDPPARALPWTRGGAAPRPPLRCGTARSPTAAHVCDTAPSIGAKRRMEWLRPLQTTPTYRYRISDSHG